jgi:hypothetical protein
MATPDPRRLKGVARGRLSACSGFRARWSQGRADDRYRASRKRTIDPLWSVELLYSDRSANTTKLTLNEWSSPAGDRRRRAHAGYSGGLGATLADPQGR